MSFIQNWQVAQNYGFLTSPKFTDTSTGTDGSLTSRRIYLKKADGSYLVPEGTTTDYTVWAIGSPTKIVDEVLFRDYCLEVTVEWMEGAVAKYTKTSLVLFRGYTDTFLLGLTRFQTSNQKLINNPNYFNNKSKLFTLLDSAEQAVLLGNDQSAAQICMDLCKELTDNKTYFF